MAFHISRLRRRFLPFLFVILATTPPAAAQVVVAPEITVPLEVPAEWQVSSFEFDVAAGDDGRALAVWAEHTLAISNRKRAVASRLFTPNTGTLAPITRQAIKGRLRSIGVGAAQESYLATWIGGPENAVLTAFGRRHDADGEASGPGIPLSSEAGQAAAVDHLSIDGAADGYTVAWGRSLEGVFARRVAATGSLGVTIRVDDATSFTDIAVANTADGGFVVVYTRPAEARGFTATGTPKAPLVLGGEIGDRLAGLAASPASDLVVALFLQHPEGTNGFSLIAQRFTAAGTLLGPPALVHEEMQFADVDAAFDRNGNLYVVWAEPSQPVRARAYDQNGNAVGPAVDIGGQAIEGIATARMAGGDFVNLWQSAAGTMRANVVSLCTPGLAVCGDGTVDPLCEMCDSGPARSDTDPDACRTDCTAPRCGDGVIDGGEQCDDGDTRGCDGCSRTCALEVGLGCGDGIAFPSCGEMCDDANAEDGDGCAACTLERIPGGGSSGSDCFAAWSVDNPSNEPRYNARGTINGTQACTDDDPRCDFDGGVPGSCTFHVQVCVNNSDQPACTPGERLASFELRKPSVAEAAKRPAAAAIRAALVSTVNASVIGTSDRDACSPAAALPVPLRGEPGSYGASRTTLSARSVLYDGRSDTDKLRLECRPAP